MKWIRIRSIVALVIGLVIILRFVSFLLLENLIYQIGTYAGATTQIFAACCGINFWWLRSQKFYINGAVSPNEQKMQIFNQILYCLKKKNLEIKKIRTILEKCKIFGSCFAKFFSLVQLQLAAIVPNPSVSHYHICNSYLIRIELLVMSILQNSSFDFNRNRSRKQKSI